MSLATFQRTAAVLRAAATPTIAPMKKVAAGCKSHGIGFPPVTAIVAPICWRALGSARCGIPLPDLSTGAPNCTLLEMLA